MLTTKNTNEEFDNNYFNLLQGLMNAQGVNNSGLLRSFGDLMRNDGKPPIFSIVINPIEKIIGVRLSADIDKMYNTREMFNLELAQVQLSLKFDEVKAKIVTQKKDYDLDINSDQDLLLTTFAAINSSFLNDSLKTDFPTLHNYLSDPREALLADFGRLNQIKTDVYPDLTFTKYLLRETRKLTPVSLNAILIYMMSANADPDVTRQFFAGLDGFATRSTWENNEVAKLENNGLGFGFSYQTIANFDLDILHQYAGGSLGNLSLYTLPIVQDKTAAEVFNKVLTTFFANKKGTTVVSLSNYVDYTGNWYGFFPASISVLDSLDENKSALNKALKGAKNLLAMSDKFELVLPDQSKSYLKKIKKQLKKPLIPSKTGIYTEFEEGLNMLIGEKK